MLYLQTNRLGIYFASPIMKYRAHDMIWIFVKKNKNLHFEENRDTHRRKGTDASLKWDPLRSIRMTA